jgi:hypothetical protein
MPSPTSFEEFLERKSMHGFTDREKMIAKDAFMAGQNAALRMAAGVCREQLCSGQSEYCSGYEQGADNCAQAIEARIKE